MGHWYKIQYTEFIIQFNPLIMKSVGFHFQIFFIFIYALVCMNDI
jgi:hypothetical protein